MFAYTAAAGCPSEERVKLLGSLAATRPNRRPQEPRGLKAQQERRQEKHMEIEARQPTGKGPPNGLFTVERGESVMQGLVALR
jgi:hypothetical protein